MINLRNFLFKNKNSYTLQKRGRSLHEYFPIFQQDLYTFFTSRTASRLKNTCYRIHCSGNPQNVQTFRTAFRNLIDATIGGKE